MLFVLVSVSFLLQIFSDTITAVLSCNHAIHLFDKTSNWWKDLIWSFIRSVFNTVFVKGFLVFMNIFNNRFSWAFSFDRSFRAIDFFNYFFSLIGEATRTEVVTIADASSLVQDKHILLSNHNIILWLIRREILRHIWQTPVKSLWHILRFQGISKCILIYFRAGLFLYYRVALALFFTK